MNKSEPTTEDTGIGEKIDGFSPGNLEFSPQAPKLHEKIGEPETNVDGKKFIEDENLDKKKQADPLLKFVLENEPLNAKEWQILPTIEGCKFDKDKNELFDKNGKSVTEIIKNSQNNMAIQSHLDMLDHFRNYPNEPYKLMDDVEKTEDGEKIYKTAGMIDNEGNVTFRPIMHEEKKEKQEEIYPSPETPTMALATEQQTTAEAVAETEVMRDVTIEPSKVVRIEAQAVEIAEVVVAGQENIVITSETNHINVAQKTTREVEKIITLEDRVRDLLRDELVQELSVDSNKTIEMKDTIIEEIEMPEIQITQTEPVQQNHIIQEKKPVAISEVVKKVLNNETEIPKAKTETVEPADAEIISPYIEQPMLERTPETVVANNQTETQVLRAEAVAITPRSEINEKIVEATVVLKEIPLILNEVKEVPKMSKENVTSKVIETVKSPREEIAQGGIEIILNTDRNENLLKDNHEMLLRILGVPLTRNEQKNELNLNESMRTRPTPYSAEEPDNTSITIKPIGIRPKVINTLNGITLKIAA